MRNLEDLLHALVNVIVQYCHADTSSASNGWERIEKDEVAQEDSDVAPTNSMITIISALNQSENIDDDNTALHLLDANKLDARLTAIIMRTATNSARRDLLTHLKETVKLLKEHVQTTSFDALIGHDEHDTLIQSIVFSLLHTLSTLYYRLNNYQKHVVETTDKKSLSLPGFGLTRSNLATLLHQHILQPLKIHATTDSDHLNTKSQCLFLTQRTKTLTATLTHVVGSQNEIIATAIETDQEDSIKTQRSKLSTSASSPSTSSFALLGKLQQFGEAISSLIPAIPEDKEAKRREEEAQANYGYNYYDF
jgi:hypothetical protein